MRSHSERQAGNAPAIEPSALPFDLAAALEAVTVVERHFNDEGLRAVVQIDGRGWVHDPEATKVELLRRWPELNESQLARAVRFINARARLAAVNHTAHTKGRNWLHDY